MNGSQQTHSLDRNGVRIDNIVDTLFGVAVPDPYRYLEDGTQADTIAWTQQQTAATRAVLDALPTRPALRARFDALLSVDSIGVPIACGSRLFSLNRRGTQEQAVLSVREGGVDRFLIDPAALDPSGLTALDWWHPSPSGALVAFGLSTNGDEQSTLHVLDVATGQRLSEAIPYTRAASLAWQADERAFYYTRFPPNEHYNMHLYHHVLGSDWAQDPLIYGEGRAPEDWLSVDLSENGRWLVVNAQRGWTASDVYFRDLTSDAPFVTLVEGKDAQYDVHCRGDELIVRSNEGAPRFALYAVDALQPARERWRVLIPEGDAVLDSFVVSAERIVVSYLRDAHSQLLSLDAGGEMAELPLPPLGTVAGLSARESLRDVYVLYLSFTVAPTVYRADPVGGSLDVWDAVATPIDPSSYRVRQVWFTSADGTRVPMYVLSHRTTKFDSTAPAVLNGYGGFNISRLPAYVTTLVPWLDAGGVYAIANLRGGGEFGEAWHRAGMLHQKQHVFDDFIAAAECLGTGGYADPTRIACIGGSNGGLLVSAAAVQRPELFRAVVCEVPLCDMIRFPRFLIARLWIAEYGDPEKAEDFAVLQAYSPYHHVQDGVAYPAMLFLTAESDSRVDPLHARKMGARVQAATAGDAPVLVHVEQHAGHGVGKPRSKQIEELADRWSFLAWQLSVTLGDTM